MVDSNWNVVAHAREGKWSGNWRMQWVASTLHTTSENGVSSITTADAHTSAASSRLNWRPPTAVLNGLVRFARKTKSGFCACAITCQLASTSQNLRIDVKFESGYACSWNLIFQSLWRIKFCLTSGENYLQYVQVYLNRGDASVPLEQQTAVGRVLRRAHAATSLTSVCCTLSNYNIAGVISVHRLWTELVSVNYCRPSNSKINLNYI